MTPERKKFKLRPRARIIKTLGEELIANDTIAITELVKNSFDADAHKVSVVFSGELKAGLGKIEIIDDGSGMDEEALIKGWFEPASVMKAEKEKSAGGRIHLGAKGIGRFSAAKLAAKLKLVSRKKNSNEISADFNWSDYGNSAGYLDEIEGEWETREPELVHETGTILTLEKLNSDWTEPKILNLRTQISRLINPLRPFEDFQIHLEFPPEFKKFSGFVTSPPSMQLPDYTIRGALSSDGNLHAEFHSKLNPEPTTLWNGVLILDSGIAPNCGPVSYEFRVWDRDRLKDLAVTLQSTISNVRQDLNEIAGISIYRDGFRVTPYGNPENDWLRLDVRRVNNPTLRLSNNQIVGELLITKRHNADLKDQSNRDGIVDSPAFDDLQEVVRAILVLLEAERYKERRLEKTSPELKHRLFRDVNLDTVRAVVEKKLPGDIETQKALDEKEREIKSTVEELHDFIVRYRRLSTLGQLIDVVLHDAGAAVTRISNGLAIITKEAKKSGSMSDKLLKNLEHSTEGSEMIQQLFKRLEPFGGRKREKSKELILETAIREVLEIYSKEINEQSVSVVVPETSTRWVASESDFKMAIINLLTNSLYWMKKDGTEHKKIEVEISSNKESITIIFSDSGPGVPSADAPYIFDPYFSKKTGGTGLGLTIVGEYISENGGTFDLLESTKIGGASFRITLPC